jgi:hypothetical protein
VSDPRLSQWLAATRRLLDLTPLERLAALDAICSQRETLMRSLAADPPAGALPTELARELGRAEAEFGRALAELRDDLGQRIAALRNARNATSGYRPTTLGTPAFVSTLR